MTNPENHCITAFGRAMRRARFERGITLGKFAAEVGVNDSYISKIELRGTRPSLGVEILIRSALELPDSLGFEIVAGQRNPRCGSAEKKTSSNRIAIVQLFILAAKLERTPSDLVETMALDFGITLDVDPRLAVGEL